MKSILSVLALASIFGSALAAPTPDFPTTQGPDASTSVAALSTTEPSHAAAVPQSVSAPSEAPSLAAPEAPELPAQPETSPEEFIARFQTLMTVVKGHTGTINATMDNFKQGQDKTIVVGLVKAELTAIFIAVSGVKDALAGVPVIVGFTVVQVQALAAIIFGIIFEIVATVAAVLELLGIQVLLFGILGQLAVVLAVLVSVVESIVGGVLVIVNDLISVKGVYESVETVFGGLPLAMANGQNMGLGM